MRRRLLYSALAVIAATLLAFALPLGLVARNLLVDRGLDALASGTERVAVIFDGQARTCGELQLLLGVAASQGRSVQLTLFTARGEPVATAGGATAVVGPELVAAVRGRTGRSHRSGQLAVAVPLATDVCAQPLILHAQQPDAAVVDSVRGTWLAIGAVGLAVLALAAVAALLLGRQLARPFEALARSARRLGDGDFTARAPRSGLPEADAVADALDSTAGRLGRAARRGAAFTADASHQLRTPMTALRLHLESLTAATSRPDAVEPALSELDRLDATIDELLALTRLEGPEGGVDLVALVAERMPAWEALAADRGRRVTMQTVPAPVVRVRPAAVGQALEVLVDNALEHGQGVVTVRVGPTVPVPSAGRPEQAGGVRICVVDEGTRAPGGMLADQGGGDRGGRVRPDGGRGLNLARSLVEAEGGRLVVEAQAATTTVCLVLPQDG